MEFRRGIGERRVRIGQQAGLACIEVDRDEVGRHVGGGGDANHRPGSDGTALRLVATAAQLPLSGRQYIDGAGSHVPATEVGIAAAVARLEDERIGPPLPGHRPDALPGAGRRAAPDRALESRALGDQQFMANTRGEDIGRAALVARGDAGDEEPSVQLVERLGCRREPCRLGGRGVAGQPRGDVHRPHMGRLVGQQAGMAEPEPAEPLGCPASVDPAAAIERTRRIDLGVDQHAVVILLVLRAHDIVARRADPVGDSPAIRPEHHVGDVAGLAGDARDARAVCGRAPDLHLAVDDCAVQDVARIRRPDRRLGKQGAVEPGACAGIGHPRSSRAVRSRPRRR